MTTMAIKAVFFIFESSWWMFVSANPSPPARIRNALITSFTVKGFYLRQNLFLFSVGLG
jgi:hypothetical protein